MLCSPVYVPVLYLCDLSDVEWTHLSPLLPGPAGRGRPRRWALRRLVNAIFYLLRTGCAWRSLPREYPPWPTVYTTFRRWRLQGVWPRVHEALRRAVRRRAGRDPDGFALGVIQVVEKPRGVKGGHVGSIGAGASPGLHVSRAQKSGQE